MARSVDNQFQIWHRTVCPRIFYPLCIESYHIIEGKTHTVYMLTIKTLIDYILFASKLKGRTFNNSK